MTHILKYAQNDFSICNIVIFHINIDSAYIVKSV